MGPVSDICVLDFSTLLPGPFASLMLAEAGARVIKIERPGSGDEMRSYLPKLDFASVNFHLLNAGKQSIAIDLKAPESFARLRPLIERAHVIIEQCRPGVMERLGYGYERLRSLNPRLIYCSITGWGQSGPKSNNAGHDLNYMAEAGLLGLCKGGDGAPVLPTVLTADLAGGALPAVVNILLALRHCDRTGEGTHLDISMADNLLPLAYWGLGEGFATGQWPGAGSALVTGATPRYQIYRTSDDRFLAAAPLEERFWRNFCALIELPEGLRDSSADPEAVKTAVATLIRLRTADAWNSIFHGHDVCCSIVATLEAAVADPHFAARRLFARKLRAGDISIPALPVPIVDGFRNGAETTAPQLGADTDGVLKWMAE